MILLNVAAFGPSLVDTTRRLGPMTMLVAAHGGRTAVHRRFGMFGVALAAAMIVLTYAILSVSAIHDRLTERRVHPVSLWAPILLFVWFAVWVSVVGPSPAWQGLAARLIR